MREQERKAKAIFNEALDKAVKMSNEEILEFLQGERATLHWAAVKAYEYVVERRTL